MNDKQENFFWPVSESTAFVCVCVCVATTGSLETLPLNLHNMPGIQFNGRALAQETSKLHSLVPQKKKRHSYLSMVAHIYNLSIQEAETGRLVQIQGHLNTTVKSCLKGKKL